MDDGAEFKYVLLNTATTSVERWEERGTNRRFLLPGGAPNHPVLVESVWGHGARCLDQDPDLCSVYGEVIMASQKEISITADKPKTTVASGQLLYDHHYIPWVMAYTTPRKYERIIFCFKLYSLYPHRVVCVWGGGGVVGIWAHIQGESIQS